MSRIIILISILFTSQNLMAQSNDVKKINELYERGYYYFYYDVYDTAVEYFEQVLSLDSDHYNSNFYLGISLGVGLEKYEEGLYYINKSFLLDSTNNLSHIYWLRGNFYFDMGKYDISIKELTMSINLDPTEKNVYYNRGMAYNRIGEFEKAISDFTKAIELGNLSPDDYYERGFAWYMLGKYQEAISDFNNCEKLGGDYPEINYFMGEMTYEYLYFQNAIEYFKTYLQEGNNEIRRLHSIFKIGVSYYYLGEYNNAFIQFNELQKYEPDYLGTFIYKGMTYMATGDYQNARQNLEKAIEIDSHNRLALLQLGNLEYLTNNPDKGYGYFNKAKLYAEKEKDEMILYGLAESYTILGDTLSALASINNVIVINPNNYKAFEARISIASVLGSKEEVLADFEHLKGIFNDNEKIHAYYHARKAVALIEFGEYEEAIVQLTKAIEIDPFSEYYALMSYIRFYYEFVKTQGNISILVQEEILQNLGMAIKTNQRKKDAYLLKTTLLIAFERETEACEAANEAIKLGATIDKEHLKFICKGKEPKGKNNEWVVNYNLSSFEERFNEGGF